MARNPRRRTTIYDVAREAEVATSTVSRTFSNPQRVNAATRKHVLEVAGRLGYQPNPLARALPSGRTQTVALLVTDITNPHFFGIIQGAERQATAAGLTLILVDTAESPELEATHIERLGRSVDGFMITSSRMTDKDIRNLASHHLLTLVSRQLEGLPSAVVDYVDGTRQIIEHLASLGHSSIVYLAGPRTSWLAKQRWRAMAPIARELGIEAMRFGSFPPTTRAGGAAADAVLRSGATAAIAYNDLLAIGMLRRFENRGVRVPEDVSVVGFDDIFGADFCSPPLTTLAGPFEELGRSAVDLLLGLCAAPQSTSARRHVVLPSSLVIRDSTGTAPTM